MRTLYVLYDERCAVCQRLRDWLLGQRSWIALSMIPSGSARAQAMFPDLDQIAGTSDLAVISDAGEVYLNYHAWIMCLYALEQYRDWALRLASPLLLPLARQAFAVLSTNRHAISRWMGSEEQDLVRELGAVAVEPCAMNASQGSEAGGLGNPVGEYLR